MLTLQSKLSQAEASIFSVIAKLSNQYKAINLGQGFPNFDCDPELKKLITKYLEEGKNQYAPMPGVYCLREVIADKCNGLYNSNISPETDVTITAGATQALFTIIQAFVREDDEVVIIEPAYDSYRPSIELAGGRVVSYRLTGLDYRINWTDFKSLLNDKTRMIIINTPHNPIGKTLSVEDMRELSSALESTNAVLLSDEVYEHLVYNGQEHQSVLRFPDLAKRAVAVYSFGKTFHSTGWKMGYCIAPDYLMQEIRNVHQWNVFSVNSFLQYALADYLSDPASYNGLSSFYQKKCDLFHDAMQLSSLKALPCDGTYFQLYDYSDVSDAGDMEFTEMLIKEYGVACIPVSPFYSESTEDKVVRFCFAKTDDVLLQAAEKLSKLQ